MRFLVFLSKEYIFSVASLCSNIFWHWNLWIWTGLDKYIHICLNISHFVLTLTRFKSCLSSHSLGFAPFTAVVHTSASFKADLVTAIRNSLSLPFTPLASFAQLTSRTTLILSFAIPRIHITIYIIFAYMQRELKIDEEREENRNYSPVLAEQKKWPELLLPLFFN